MRILDSTLTYSNLASKTQSHQPLFSVLKDLNNRCAVVVVDIEKYVTQGNYSSNKF